MSSHCLFEEVWSLLSSLDIVCQFIQASRHIIQSSNTDLLAFWYSIAADFAVSSRPLMFDWILVLQHTSSHFAFFYLILQVATISLLSKSCILLCIWDIKSSELYTYVSIYMLWNALLNNVFIECGLEMYLGVFNILWWHLLTWSDNGYLLSCIKVQKQGMVTET